MYATRIHSESGGAAGRMRSSARTLPPSGDILEISRETAGYVLPPTDDSPIRLTWGEQSIERDEAVRWARMILPLINRFSGGTRDVPNAVQAIDRHGGSHELLMATARAIGRIEQTAPPGATPTPLLASPTSCLSQRGLLIEWPRCQCNSTAIRSTNAVEARLAPPRDGHPIACIMKFSDTIFPSATR
jgi:hypothetical protein